MKNKVWHKVEISTEEQNISVYPTEGYDGIIVEAISSSFAIYPAKTSARATVTAPVKVA